MSASPGRLESLFAEHGRFVFRVARRLGIPARDVEDVTQEVFVVAFRKLNDFDGASPRGWLFRITSRVVSDYRKRASNRNEDLSAALPDECSGVSQDEEVWKRQMRTALDEVMDELKPAERGLHTVSVGEALDARVRGADRMSRADRLLAPKICTREGSP